MKLKRISCVTRKASLVVDAHSPGASLHGETHDITIIITASHPGQAYDYAVQMSKDEAKTLAKQLEILISRMG